MNNQLTVAEQPQIKKFNHEIFGELDVLVKDGKEYLPATDVATTLEYAKPHKAVTDHCDEDEALTWGVIDRLGRKQQKKFITIGNVSRLIIAAARQSKNPLIKEKATQYERWIFDEVIPSIHKHGAYMIDQVLEQAVSNPDFAIGLLTKLKEEKQKLAAAQRQIEQQRQKGLFADSVSAAETSILVRGLAKILRQNGVDTGEKRLFKWLRENGYLVKKKGADYNSPTQYSMELGLFNTDETSITRSSGKIELRITPKVTGKGQLYFINKFLGKNQTA
ncbi:phage antirepressor [Bacillus thuringiensis]